MLENGNHYIAFPNNVKQNDSDDLRSNLTLIPSAFIKDISVDSCVEVEDHYEFLISIQGTTRFMHTLNGSEKYTCYKKLVRYSALLELHKVLSKELQPYLKAGETKMPEFPGKSWFGSAKTIAQKRVITLNYYFAELINKYSSILTNSPTLLNFFEPYQADLNIIGCSDEQCKSFVKALIMIITHMDSEPIDSSGLCKITQMKSYKDLLVKLSEAPKIANSPREIDWESYTPFDYMYDGMVYRVDIQNLNSSETPCDSDIVINMYQTSSSVCMIALDMTKKSSFIKVKEILGNIKLFLTEGGFQIPPFMVVGFGHEQTHHEVTEKDVSDCLLDMFGDKCPYKYVEVSYITGHNMLKALDTIISTVRSLKKLA